MNTTAPDTDLYLFPQEQDALAALTPEIAEYITGNRLHLNTVSMAAILNIFAATDGVMGRVVTHVERTWDERRFAAAEAASLECCTRSNAHH